MATRGNSRTTRPAAQTGATPEEVTTPQAAAGAAGAPDTTGTPGVEATGTPDGQDTPDTDTPDTPDVDTPDVDTPDAADGDGRVEGPEPTWSEVVPLVALMVGSAPSPDEVEAARLLWTMLSDTEEGVTAASFVRRAEFEDWPEVETTTVKAVLGRYERVGIVRCEQTDRGRQRWTLGSPSDVVAAVTTVGARPRSARTSALTATATATATASGRDGRHWAPGELKSAVADYLHAHPGEAFKAQGVCDGIGTHQHGSVRAALDSLTRAGDIVQVTDSPRSWQTAQS